MVKELTSFSYVKPGKTKIVRHPLYQATTIFTKAENKMGGGVGIFVNERIRFTEVTLNANYENIEYVVINITTKNKNKTIMLGSLYRPPNTNETIPYIKEHRTL